MDNSDTGDLDAKALDALGKYLTSQYGIIRRVFSFLSVFDLTRCEQVCQDWKEPAAVTIKERRRIQCLTLMQQEQEPYISSDAQLTVSFCTVPVISDSCAFLSKEEHHFVSLHGVISLLNNVKPILRRNRVELPLTPRNYLLTAVRFPPVEGVVMHTATFSESPVSNKEFKNALKLPGDVPIKAMILIATEDRNIGNPNLIHLLTATDFFGSIAVGGCRLDFGEEGDNNVTDRMKVIMFGGPNVEAASCILSDSCRTREDINNRVEQFSKDVSPMRNSVLIAFRCCARQKVRRRYNYKPKENVETWETNAIRNHFPLTPTIGCYGVGEFGTNCPSLSTTKKQKLLRNELYDLSFSTVLLYIGFKK